LGWWLLTLGWIDLRHWLLPDLLTLPLLATGLGVTAAFDVEDLADHAVGAVVGYLGLLAAAEAYRLLRGRKALGAGDAKLLGAAGAWLGVAALPQVVLLAALTALAAAAGLSVAGIRLHAPSALPFGAFLALAIWSVWLFGPVPL
jgi:leader peptidase (prepilin peptidase)/N-methyltransferase